VKIGSKIVELEGWSKSWRKCGEMRMRRYGAGGGTTYCYLRAIYRSSHFKALNN
jgi:hypothetical protein